MTASVRQGRLEDAFDRLDEVAALVRVPWAMREKLRGARENYRFMSDFAMTGGQDDSRADRYAALCAEALALGDLMLREAKSIDTPSLYYSVLRFERTRPDETPGILIERYLAALAAGADAVALESIEGRLFNRVWTTHPLGDADVEVLSRYVVSSDSPLPDHLRRLLVSALMLGATEWADLRRTRLLLDVYQSNHDAPIAIEALTAAVMVALATPRGTADLGVWADTPGDSRRRKDLEMVVKQTVCAFDTERISRKMTDEVLPELMKLKPEIDRRISDLTRDAEGKVDLASIEENPEWDKLMNRSGLADKLREMNDLQLEGSDVMMSTFASLKSFPFFNDPGNWFLPFHRGQSVVRKAGDKAVAKLSRLVQSMPVLCDSDKYSLMLLTGHMGGTGFTNMMQALEEQAEAMNEDVKSDLDEQLKKSANVARRYVQNAYRFFRLFRRKNEFRDPFINAGRLLEIEGLKTLFAGGSELTATTAEFLFGRGHYANALPLLKAVADSGIPTAEIYQKIGYAMQRGGDLPGALEMYQNSDLLRGDSLWTLKRIGSILRTLGRSSEAVGYLRRAYELDSENVSLMMSLAGALLESGHPKEALNLYYKADYLKPGERTMRLIAWCLFMTGEYERSRDSYAALGRMPGGFSPSDLMNLGHLDIIFNCYGEAAEHYASAIADYNFDTERFESELASDRKILEARGIDPVTIDLIADRALRLSREMGSTL